MTAPSFTHLKKAEVNAEAEHPYKFVELDPAPTVWFKPAISTNKAWFKDNLRRQNAKPRSGKKQRATEASVEDSRQEDREQFAQFCATRWDEKVIDDKGVSVEFSAANCQAWFEALPDDIFDGLRLWLFDASNFREGDGTELGEG